MCQLQYAFIINIFIKYTITIQPKYKRAKLLLHIQKLSKSTIHANIELK